MARTEPSLETAAVIRNVPAGGISATDLQLAINELDAEKVAISGGVITGNLSVSGTLTGAASLNVLKTGGIMTGNLSLQTIGGVTTLTIANGTIIKQAGQPFVFDSNLSASNFDSSTQVPNKVSVNTNSILFPVQASTAPTYAKGGMYYNMTSGKLAIGGASGWEMIQSNV